MLGGNKISIKTSLDRNGPPLTPPMDNWRNLVDGEPVMGTVSDQSTDVLVVGGGLVGLSLARAIAGSGLGVIIVDRESPKQTVSDIFDGRVSSIARGSVNMLKRLGVWTSIRKDAQPIEEIRVTDSGAPFFLHYASQDVGNEPMGYILENRILRCALHRLVESDSRIVWRTGVEVKAIERGAYGVTAELSDGTKASALLVAAADGRRSVLRANAGIDVVKRSYRQVGIVCTVAHSYPHGAIAHERFLSAGPFAILPMTGNRSSLVWTERPEVASTILKLSTGDFLKELAWRFGDFLGKLEVVSPRWHYPLELTLAGQLVARRLALVGDAAHAIHPIAGQGLNLGLRDAAALTEVVVRAQQLGMDFGEPVVLDGYGRWRRFDGLAMAAVTDSLNRLFSNDITPLREARVLGLATVNKLPSLKAVFQRHAMGVLGRLPELLRDISQ